MSCSKCRFFFEPHCTHWPRSRRQTSTFTGVGINRLCGSSTTRPNDFFSTRFQRKLEQLSSAVRNDVCVDQFEETLVAPNPARKNFPFSVHEPFEVVNA